MTNNKEVQPTHPTTRNATFLLLHVPLFGGFSGVWDGGFEGGDDGISNDGEQGLQMIAGETQSLAESDKGPHGHWFLQGPGSTLSKTFFDSKTSLPQQNKE